MGTARMDPTILGYRMLESICCTMIIASAAKKAWLNPSVINPTKAAGIVLIIGPKYGMILHIPAKHPKNTANSRSIIENAIEDSIAMSKASNI